MSLTLLRTAILVWLINSTTANADIMGIGYEVSKDEVRSTNYLYEGRLRGDLGFFQLKQDNTKMYGLSIGLGYSVVDRKYFDILAGFHINPGFSHTEDASTLESSGGNMYYDVGLTPNLKLWIFRLTSFLGYRKDHGSYVVTKGNIHNDGFVARLGLGIEF